MSDVCTRTEQHTMGAYCLTKYKKCSWESETRRGHWGRAQTVYSEHSSIVAIASNGTLTAVFARVCRAFAHCFPFTCCGRFLSFWLWILSYTSTPSTRIPEVESHFSVPLRRTRERKNVNRSHFSVPKWKIREAFSIDGFSQAFCAMCDVS